MGEIHKNFNYMDDTFGWTWSHEWNWAIWLNLSLFNEFWPGWNWAICLSLIPSMKLITWVIVNDLDEIGTHEWNFFTWLELTTYIYYIDIERNMNIWITLISNNHMMKLEYMDETQFIEIYHINTIVNGWWNSTTWMMVTFIHVLKHHPYRELQLCFQMHPCGTFHPCGHSHSQG